MPIKSLGMGGSCVWLEGVGTLPAGGSQGLALRGGQRDPW